MIVPPAPDWVPPFQVDLSQVYPIGNGAPLTVTDAAIPDELRRLDQWVSWRSLPNPGKPKPKKLLYTPGTNAYASSTDPATWRSYAEAVTAVQRGEADGIGFVFTDEDPYFGIDLDKCRNPETGELEPWAQAIVDRFATYTEPSPTGTGVHLVGRGVKPATDSRKGDQIECYDTARYFTVTGAPLPGRDTIRNCQHALTTWHREVWPVEKAKASSPTTVLVLTMDDRTLVERLSNERNGKAARLLAGDMTGFPSPSEARGALAWKCCYYTDDEAQIARILRAHGPWSDADSDKERDRKAALDAQEAVKDYTGPRYTPTFPHAGNVPSGHEHAEMLDLPTPPVGGDCGEVVAHLREVVTRQQEAITQLQQENTQLRRDRDMLMAMELNPHTKASERIAMLRVFELSRKEPADEDGRVTLKPGQISNDWRPKAKAHENTAKLNPDGSRYLMARSSVLGTMRTMTGDRQWIDAIPEKQEVKPKGREPYEETVWRVSRPTSLAEFLEPVATYDPEDKAVRKTRTLPCRECGEVHPMTVQTTKTVTCHGCGSTWEETSEPRVQYPIVEIGPREYQPAAMQDDPLGRRVDPENGGPVPIRPERDGHQRPLIPGSDPSLGDYLRAGGWT